MMHRVILLAIVLAATKPTALAQVALEAPQKVVKVECCPEGGCTASVAVALQEEKSKKSDKATKSNRTVKIVRSTDDGSGANIEVMEGPEVLKAVQGLKIEDLEAGKVRVLRIDETDIQEERSKKADKPQKSARAVKIVRTSQAGAPAEIVVEVEGDDDASEEARGQKIIVLTEDVQEEKGSAPSKKAPRFRVTRPEGTGVFRLKSAPDSEAGTKAERMVYLSSLGGDKVLSTPDDPHALRWVETPPTGGGIVPQLFSMAWSERAEREDEPGEALAFGWSTQSPTPCCEAPSLDAIRKVVREELTRAMKIALKDQNKQPTAVRSAKPKSKQNPTTTAWLATPNTMKLDLATIPQRPATAAEPLAALLLKDAALPKKSAQPDKAKGLSEADRLRREMKELVKRIANLERALEKLDR